VQTVVSARGIVNRFGTQVVHDGVDFDVHAGEVFGIVGGSGSGKSVLLKTLLGLRRPDAGTVCIEGREITAMGDTELRDIKRRYGVTFQHGALFSSLTVSENVALPVVEAVELSPATVASLVELRLRMVGLPLESAGKFPAQLSGGMIKRAALARALALDPIAAAAFDSLVLYLREALGLTVVMVTHDLDTLVRTCDRVAVLVDGKVIVDTLEGIVANDHPWIRQYFHGARGRAAHLQTEPRDGA